MNKIIELASCIFTIALPALATCCTTSTIHDPRLPDTRSALASNTAASADVLFQGDNENSVALERLWKARLSDSADDRSSESFVLGRGDLLRISILPIGQPTVRVSEEDTITLPLLGDINVAGMTEKDLRTVLLDRMSKYRYHPEVQVFLEKAEDRQVAVLGAVKTPGRYMMTSRSDTLMTMIGRAGGFTTGAATRIFLIPAGADEVSSPARSGTVRIASTQTSAINPVSGRASGEDEAGSAPKVALSDMGAFSGQHSYEQLAIDTSQPRGQRYLEIPARPGDALVVPVAGEVTVQGWVQKAGSFPVTPEMSVLNAIAAAGGAQFSSSATLLRETPDRGKQAVALDLSKLKRGEQPDPQVQGGDVIVVERSIIGALPYSAYFLSQHVGLGIPLY